jgi:subtilisin family serine protease
MRKILLLILALWVTTPGPLAQDGKIRIAVIDTGINQYAKVKGLPLRDYMCESGHTDLTGKGIEDINGHGTNIAAIIAEGMNPAKQCLVIIKFYHNKEHEDTLFKDKINSYKYWYYARITENGLIAALRADVSYINMSQSGGSFFPKEERLLREFIASGVTVVVAAGNDNLDLSKACVAYPACYNIKNKRFKVVANYTWTDRAYMSNYNGPVNARENGMSVYAGGKILSGTSQAAAVHMSRIIRGLK